MKPINFFVQGDPKGQPRPRAFARKIGNTYMARVYDAGTAECWKSQIALAAKPYLPTHPLEGPLEVTVDLYFRRPKSHFTRKGLRENAPFWHVTKPDRDNCDKAVLDALKTVGVFKDDSQVCAGPVHKYYSNGLVGAAIQIKDAPMPDIVLRDGNGAATTAVYMPRDNYPHHD